MFRIQEVKEFPKKRVMYATVQDLLNNSVSSRGGPTCRESPSVGFLTTPLVIYLADYVYFLPVIKLVDCQLVQ